MLSSTIDPLLRGALPLAPDRDLPRLFFLGPALGRGPRGADAGAQVARKQRSDKKLRLKHLARKLQRIADGLAAQSGDPPRATLPDPP